MQETCNGDTSGLSEAPAANSPGGAEQPERRLALVCQLLASDAGERLSEIFQPVGGYSTHSSLWGKGKERRKAIKDKQRHDHTHQPSSRSFPWWQEQGHGQSLAKGYRTTGASLRMRWALREEPVSWVTGGGSGTSSGCHLLSWMDEGLGQQHRTAVRSLRAGSYKAREKWSWALSVPTRHCLLLFTVQLMPRSMNQLLADK